MVHYDDTTNESAEYAAFIEKFKPKKTTDDCYTPQIVYKAVLEWVVNHYEEVGKPGQRVLRPFRPGGDYQAEDYSGDCVVIDNPPFSILSSICQWYDARGIRYFLFAPALTLFSINSGRCNYVVSASDITYENGACVRTSFVTNMGKDKVVISGGLTDRVIAADRENRHEQTRTPPKYSYPANLITAATLLKQCKAGVEIGIPASSCSFTRALDSQREHKKAIYGAGFLVSDWFADMLYREASGHDARPWPLSERERGQYCRN